MKEYSPYQFSIFRIILGIYLVVHFSMLIPYAAEIWSEAGMLPDPSSNLTYGVFPNILYSITSTSGVTLFIIFLTVLSLLFLIGYQRPIVSILLWYGWASLFDRNNLINNPGIPYVGWLLLCCAVLPKGEPLSLSKSTTDSRWEMPAIIFYGAWALMAIGYTVSGFDKYLSPSWKDGSAMIHLLENPLARDWWLREFILSFPEWILKIKTWVVLFIEMAFLPLAIFTITRKWIWLAMIGMHLGILMVVDFADLTLGMLMIHWFTFDSRWFEAKPKHSGIVYFDGVCGMCNTFINFLLSEDQKATLQYAPLQGDTAKSNIDSKYSSDLNTVVYQEGDKVYSELDAILKSVASIGGIWRLVLVLRIVPNFIGNRVYRFVSMNRYQWFGKKEDCRMPTPEERERILT